MTGTAVYADKKDDKHLAEFFGLLMELETQIISMQTEIMTLTTGGSGGTGDKGETGDKGDTGATGSDGAKGDKGDPGTGEVTQAQLDTEIDARTNADLIVAGQARKDNGARERAEQVLDVKIEFLDERIKALEALH